ncbi:hypothetical protein ABEG18_13250 [Alsobacter sp. KACC 23698]|uniref:Uncharacterized protein n=1 Tax=Alsobacter sp. KACC 23698 TaxID=3149229 RepID=A0AAU7J8M7_9HYPH
MPIPVDSPTLTLAADDLVDWLELTALFSPFGLARLDALLGSLQELEETAEDDIGERDRRREQRIESLENEVEFRRRTLGDTYPFELDESGEELILNENWREPRFSFYMICLITTHVSGSTILALPPTGDLLTQLRNKIFQIVATLGLAGLATGPAFSVGWPRQSRETIIELLTRAAAMGGGFSVRNPPSAYVSPHEKDGGVDVIAWTAEGMPPPTAFFFGQTASGRNWRDKPVKEHARVFGQAYMFDHMTGNRVYVTIIPYRVFDDAFWNTLHQFHMAILDRLRLPRRAWQGFQLATQGVSIDGSERVHELTRWLGEYLDYANAS